MATVVISYPKSEGSHFNADYYRDVHMPLAERMWAGHGLTGTEILWPADDNQPYAVILILRFRDAASIDATLAVPGTAEVMADVPNFTNIQATLYRTA